ncbi:MAG: ABC transporter substrate-binding protein [Lachnospirales bacterium]
MKVKKILGLVFVVGMVMSTGCSAKTSSESKAPESSSKEKTLTVWSRGNETDRQSQAFKDAVIQFEEQEGATVDYQIIPHPDVVTKWNSAFASGTAPDVMDVGIVHIVERINLGHIVPLNDFVDTWAGKDDIYPQILDIGTMNENIYAIGHLPDPQVFMYRKDMFAEAGLDPETPPANWDELLEYAEKLTVKDEEGNITRGGIAVPTQSSRFMASILVRQNEGTFADETTGLPTMNSKEGIETLEFMSKLHEYSTIFDNGKSETIPLFLDSAAMGYVANSQLANYLEKNPDMVDKVGIIADVPGKTDAAWCGVWFYSITSQAENPELAWKFINFMTSKEILTDRIASTGLATPFASTAEEFIKLDPVLNEAIIGAIEVGAGNPKVSWAPLYEKALDTAGEEVFYGVKTPEEALNDAQTKLLEEIE